MSGLMQLAYRVQKLLWKLLRPRTRGVKVMLFNATGEILLIRNSYGDTHSWLIPGGGIKPWESPAQAAKREMREELGCGIDKLHPVSTHFATAEGKRDTIILFEAIAAGDPNPDGTEVVEARFFALDQLPQTVSPATRRRLAERLGEKGADRAW